MIAQLGRALVIVLSLSAGLLMSPAARGDEPNPEAVKPAPSRDRFLVIPLRVHILKASKLPEVDCHLTEADISRILGKVNRVWQQAEVFWGLESLVNEPAARQDSFRLALSLNAEVDLALYRLLVPKGPTHDRGIDVYFLHELPANGVWMGEDYVIVKETAELRSVPGGIDEPIPRVTSHELGHTLGLSHHADKSHLLASGTTGTVLGPDEAEGARREATKTRGAWTVDELTLLATKAVEERDAVKARRYWGWLAAIPGEGANEARRQLERVEADAAKSP
ncbi:Matrixin [Singulisphaera rosea]